EVLLADHVAVDRPLLVLREEDRDLGADARAGGAVGLAVALVLDRELVVLVDAVDLEQAEREALHAVGAAVVVDDGEPGLPRLELARAGLLADLARGAQDGVGAQPAHVPHVGAVDRRRLAAFEPAEHEHRRAVGLRHGAARGRTGDFEAVLEEGGDRVVAVLRRERSAARSFVEDHAQILSLGLVHWTGSPDMIWSAVWSRMLRTSTPSFGSGAPAAWKSHFTARG